VDLRAKVIRRRLGHYSEPLGGAKRVKEERLELVGRAFERRRRLDPESRSRQADREGPQARLARGAAIFEILKVAREFGEGQ
jgi:hypothetical protein